MGFGRLGCGGGLENRQKILASRIDEIKRERLFELL